MVITLKINATPENISVNASQANLSLQARSVIAYDAEGQSIFAVGQTADELQETFPIEWERRKTALEFSFPFDVDRFSPALATVIIQYYAMMTHVETRPLYKRWLTELYDRFDLELNIQGYEQLSDIQRREFEAMVFSNGVVTIRQLLINGQPPTVEGGSLEERTRDIRRGWLTAITLMGPIALWFLGLLSVTWLIYKSVTPPGQLTRPLEWPGAIIVLGVAVGVIAVLVYLAFALGIITFVLIARCFLPTTTLRNFLLGYKIGLPKAFIVWLVDKVANVPSHSG